MIIRIAEKLHDWKKERNKNMSRNKIAEAITKNNANTPERIQEVTKLNLTEINSILCEFENEEYIVCNYGGASDSCYAFEQIKPFQ